ncbi:CDP-alcohol phosphatidyltransferase [Actinophytocola oryzae]|uniref:CDP-alcohol phosphatidyltransferase n=1 Tax=Actinophytocola oryzae TaxID=502181 RepID=UPI001062CAE5|nr:CDP-alcohol phosphatidyltransferase [Actinophytocola oryzae]
MDVLIVLFVVLTVAVRLGPAGWLAGIAYAVLGWAVLADGIQRYGIERLDTASRVTLARAVAVGGVAALVVETTDPRPDPVLALVVISVVALALGLVRRAEDEFARRFADEVDAFLVLALSAFVATRLGVWVMAIGLAHYLLLAAGRWFTWLRGDLPPQRTRTIVTAAQGFVLTAVATGLLPTVVAIIVTALALGTLAVLHVQDVRWLHQHRETAPETETDTAEEPRTKTRWVLTALAGLLVLAALVGPNQLGQLGLAAYARIPVEGLMAAALVLVLGTRARRVAVIVIGAGLGLLMIVKFLDMGFYEVFDRPFHVIFDWTFFGPALDFVVTSVGQVGAVLAVIAVILLVFAIMVLMVFAVRRLTRLGLGHRSRATHLLAALGVVWLVAALSGVQLTPQEPIASRSAADHVYDDVRQVREGLTDGKTFAAQAADDKYRYTPGKDLLTSLRGKDVLFVFVESYGRVAVEKSDSAPVIDPVLDEGTEELKSAGFDSASAFLTSPTYGGGSWLAHATLQTGLWVDNQQRRFTLNELDRMTLSIAFNRAGWRTSGVVPANTEDWPDGDMYHFDKVYDSRNVGYEGPKFGYGPVPDQYTLQRFEHDERRRYGPVMAEIDLVSSHTPFTPIPTMVDWDKVGDGSVYDPMPAKGPQAGDVWPDPTKVRAAYTASIKYSLQSLISYIRTYGDDDLVVVFLGDHQPAPIIASQEGTRDVPITIVAKDPAVMRDMRGWGWDEGLNPSPKAPVWPMDQFRDRFLAAYGPPSGPGKTDTHAASPR